MIGAASNFGSHPLAPARAASKGLRLLPVRDAPGQALWGGRIRDRILGRLWSQGIVF
jgi:hypothetical protein